MKISTQKDLEGSARQKKGCQYRGRSVLSFLWECPLVRAPMGKPASQMTSHCLHQCTQQALNSTHKKQNEKTNLRFSETIDFLRLGCMFIETVSKGRKIFNRPIHRHQEIKEHSNIKIDNYEQIKATQYRITFQLKMSQ